MTLLWKEDCLNVQRKISHTTCHNRRSCKIFLVLGCMSLILNKINCNQNHSGKDGRNPARGNPECKPTIVETLNGSLWYWLPYGSARHGQKSVLCPPIMKNIPILCKTTEEFAEIPLGNEKGKCFTKLLCILKAKVQWPKKKNLSSKS